MPFPIINLTTGYFPSFHPSYNFFNWNKNSNSEETYKGGFMERLLCNVSASNYFQGKDRETLLGKSRLEIVLDGVQNWVEQMQKKRTFEYNDVWLLKRYMAQLDLAVEHEEENGTIDEEIREEIDAVRDDASMILAPPSYILESPKFSI